MARKYKSYLGKMVAADGLCGIVITEPDEKGYSRVRWNYNSEQERMAYSVLYGGDAHSTTNDPRYDSNFIRDMVQAFSRINKE